MSSIDSPAHASILAGDGHSLGHSLFKWLQTFELSANSSSSSGGVVDSQEQQHPHPKTVSDLSDGVVISNCLALIDPDFFDAEWLAKLKTDVPANNWRLKLSNLKKVLKGILDFYADILGQHIRDFHMPDLNVIAERGDVVETGRLLQLVLGCAVNCDKKQHYIEEIMGMEEAVQHVVMNAIQELMNKETPASPGGEALHAVSDQLKKALDELNQSETAKEELLQRCHQLNFQVNSLNEENLHLKSEQSRLNERLLSGSDEMEDPSTPVGRKFLQLQQQIEQLQESLEIVENQKEDLQIRAELQQKETTDLRSKNEQLSLVVEDSAHLKDELDILRDKSLKAEKMETVVETYKRKLEDAADVKRQMKLLEEKNASFLEKTLNMEEELRKSSSVKNQLENYKRQVQELKLKLADEIKRADRAEFEKEKNAENLSHVEAERRNLQSEREALKETVEELTYGQTGFLGVDDSGGGAGEDEDLESSTEQMEYLSLAPEMKAKFMRLKKENKLLKAAAAGSRRQSHDSVDGPANEEDALGSDGVFLRQRLSDAQTRVSELEEENKSDHRKILELEASAKEAEARLKEAEAKEKRDAAAAERLKVELKAAEAELKASDGKATDEFSDVVRRMESEMEHMKEKSEKMEEEVKREKERNREIEERYKRYLEKAKNIIKDLDPRNNAKSDNSNASAADKQSSSSLDASAKQLAEKEAQIGRLQRENVQIKQLREKEDHYVASAWYTLSAQLAKKGADDRLASFINGPSNSSSSSSSANNYNSTPSAASTGAPSSSQGYSFLARQRQAHSRKLTLNTGGNGAS